MMDDEMETRRLTNVGCVITTRGGAERVQQMREVSAQREKKNYKPPQQTHACVHNDDYDDRAISGRCP